MIAKIYSVANKGLETLKVEVEVDVGVDMVKSRIKGLYRKVGVKGRGRLVLWCRGWVDVNK